MSDSWTLVEINRVFFINRSENHKWYKDFCTLFYNFLTAQFLIQEMKLQLVTNILEIMMLTACVLGPALEQVVFSPMEEHPASHHP